MTKDKKVWQLLGENCALFESALHDKYGAQGKGLWEKLKSVEGKIPSNIVQCLGFNNKKRNELLHYGIYPTPKDVEFIIKNFDLAGKFFGIDTVNPYYTKEPVYSSKIEAINLEKPPKLHTENINHTEKIPVVAKNNNSSFYVILIAVILIFSLFYMINNHTKTKNFISTDIDKKSLTKNNVDLSNNNSNAIELYGYTNNSKNYSIEIERLKLVDNNNVTYYPYNSIGTLSTCQYDKNGYCICINNKSKNLTFCFDKASYRDEFYKKLSNAVSYYKKNKSNM